MSWAYPERSRSNARSCRCRPRPTMPLSGRRPTMPLSERDHADERASNSYPHDMANEVWCLHSHPPVTGPRLEDGTRVRAVVVRVHPFGLGVHLDGGQAFGTSMRRSWVGRVSGALRSTPRWGRPSFSKSWGIRAGATNSDCGCSRSARSCRCRGGPASHRRLLHASRASAPRHWQRRGVGEVGGLSPLRLALTPVLTDGPSPDGPERHRLSVSTSVLQTGRHLATPTVTTGRVFESGLAT
jgi:hypothetical protein